MRIVRRKDGQCPTCGHEDNPMAALYRELTDSTMTWIDLVTWLTVGAVIGGVVVWGIQ